MNALDFICQLLHICDLPTLLILTPLCSPYTPSTNCAHLSFDYDNTSIDYTDFSINYANKFDDCANVPND